MEVKRCAANCGDRLHRVATAMHWSDDRHPRRPTTEFTIGAGRTEGDPALDDYLPPEDGAHASTTVLRQPRRVRTTQWQLWSMGESG
jgi:hypothetical protein